MGLCICWGIPLFVGGFEGNSTRKPAILRVIMHIHKPNLWFSFGVPLKPPDMGYPPNKDTCNLLGLEKLVRQYKWV